MKILSVIALALFSTTAWAIQIPPINGKVTAAANGANDRYALPDKGVSSCTIQAKSGNVGSIYVGGSTVTNAGGANPGVKLNITGSISNIAVTNSNMIYMAADNVGDGVTYICN